MLKVILVSCFCVAMSLNLLEFTDGKPIAGFELSDNPKVTTIKLPSATISGEELVALAQYVMRVMASRINITLQTATNHNDFPSYADPVPLDSPSVQSTTSTTVMPSKDYEIFRNTMETGNELTRCADQKSTYPCRTGGGEVKSLSQDLSPPLNKRPILGYEKFVRYPNENGNSFPDEISPELVPNTEILPTYIPQKDKSTGVLPLMEQVVINPLLPPAEPIMSENTSKKDLGSSGIIRTENLTIDQVPPSQSGNSVMSVPFEAVITFTRQKPTSSSKVETDDDNIVIPTRNPPDDFPPYFQTTLPSGKKTSDSKIPLAESISSTKLTLISEKNLDPGVVDTGNKVTPDKKQGLLKPMKKRQTPKVGELLQMIGLSTKRSKGNRKRVATSATPSSSSVTEPSGNIKPQKLSTVTLEVSTTSPTKVTPMLQRQEFDDEDDEEEEEEEEEEEQGGSVAALADLLPLVAPILEDLSDPNTETDIAEILQAGLPLIQDISQGTDGNDAVDVVGLITPIISSLSGPNRDRNGTVFQTILPLILPLVTPFIGPIVGPIIQGLSNPADQGGSSITPVIQAVAGPLSLPTEPGGISIASSLISGVIASLSKDLKPGNGGSDIGALVSTLVSGVIAGGSAGVKAKFMKPPPPPPPPPPPNNPGYPVYGQGPVPASSVDPLELVGTGIKEIFGLTLELIKSVVSSVTGILGASSSEQPKPVYGPAKIKSRVT